MQKYPLRWSVKSLMICPFKDNVIPHRIVISNLEYGNFPRQNLREFVLES